MKRWQIITLGIIVISALAVRAIYKVGTSRDEERLWYVSNLKYSFSAVVDSIRIFNSKRPHGFVTFHVTHGQLRRRTEDSLNRRLRHYDGLRFTIGKGKFRIYSNLASSYQVGDSIRVSSADDKIIFFHEGKPVGEEHISKVLRGRSD